MRGTAIPIWSERMAAEARTVLPPLAQAHLPRAPRLPAIHLPVILIVPPCAGGRTLPIPLPAPSSASSGDSPAPETAIAGADPDRPHMAHGQQSMSDDFQPAQLTGVPSGLEQMIAVSDASDREAHPFVYLWADPADATNMQTQMEIAASNAIAASPAAGKATRRKRTLQPRAHCNHAQPRSAVRRPRPRPPPRSWFLPTSASRPMS